MNTVKWNELSPNNDLVSLISDKLNISKITSNILVNRNINSIELADKFLNIDITGFHDPFLMKDMSKAVMRIRKAIKNKEKIVIYGDYDVDGTTSTVILKKCISLLGGDISYFIPERLKDGYGLRDDGMLKLKEAGFSLVITVDTGVKAFEVVDFANSIGLDIIITDHHLTEGKRIPAAIAVLNPKRKDCKYPEKNLAGVGVAFKLVHGLLKKAGKEELVLSFSKIACLGTIADMVDISGENRVIVKYGLEGLKKTNNSGLDALLDIAAIDRDKVSYRDIAFRVAPRINAMGRMGSASPVIELFDSESVGEALTRAGEINAQNSLRQNVQKDMVEEILRHVEQNKELVSGKIIVLDGEGWHKGVIGIAASRVMEIYGRPVIIIGVEGGVGVGSGRAPAWFHLVDAMNSCADLFEKFGGHAQAAGCSLKADNMPFLRERLNTYAETVVKEESLVREINIDCSVEFKDITYNLLNELIRLEPFGIGNKAPLFMAKGVHLISPVKVLKEKHLKLRVADEAGFVFDCLWWNASDKEDMFAVGELIDIVFKPEENEWAGRKDIQLIIEDAKTTEDESFL